MAYFSGMNREWYELFSRGARDWLRHNEKIREAVLENLPDLLSGADVMTGEGSRTVQVPVRILEHFRFRLQNPDQQEGVGQGQVEPGDVLRPARQPGQGRQGGGQGEGEVKFMMELNVDDLTEWLWDELELPNLQPLPGAVEEDEYEREGWDRQGARARLDRRRTLKEAIKRRVVQPDGPAFTNDDLRYRQLVRRPRPSTQALVIFGLDASSSMTERDRKLAKMFFFWALQGLRRQYTSIETVFIGHTTKAWEFSEEEFFKVTAQGGTVASTAFNLGLEIIADRFPPDRYNIYFFYASDGENYPEDRQPAAESLHRLGSLARYVGYVETTPRRGWGKESETASLFHGLEASRFESGVHVLIEPKDVWEAIKSFFAGKETG
jgi:uncharacterized protein